MTGARRAKSNRLIVACERAVFGRQKEKRLRIERREIAIGTKFWFSVTKSAQVTAVTALKISGKQRMVVNGVAADHKRRCNLNMYSACLVIHKISFDHIAHVARFVHAALVDSFGPATGFIVCDDMDDAAYPDGAIVFVIGEMFRPHQRRLGCLYVYLNFSIVMAMGNPLHLSKVGWSAIRRKRRMLAQKQAHFDVLLDYLAPQTTRLQRQLDLPVFGFDIGVDPAAINTDVPLEDRPYDICFVGAMTPRRAQVVAALNAQGLRLSPHVGVVYEDVAAQSRCCINIHAYRSNHLETPRIIGAIAAGTPLVTELSYGMDTLLPADITVTTRLAQLADTAGKICLSPDTLRQHQRRAQDWYQQIYLPQCKTNWAILCGRIGSLHRGPSNPRRINHVMF